MCDYSNFRRYFRSFVDLPLAAESGSESVLKNLALLRQLNQGELKALPPDVDTSFVPVAWMQQKPNITWAVL